MKSGYICDNCQAGHVYRSFIFRCLWCEKEICESCMYSWQACKECAVGKTDQQLEIVYNEAS